MGKHKQPGMSILAVQNDILPITYWKKLEILENAGVVWTQVLFHLMVALVHFCLELGREQVYKMDELLR